VHDLFGPVYGALAADDDAGVRLREADLAGEGAPRYRKVFGTTIALPARLP
jgi:type IV pilus assembly protein PilW